MALRLKPAKSVSPFSWQSIASPPKTPSPDPATLPSPPTTWLPATDMKIFGARPITATSDIGLVRCDYCQKPVLRSCVSEHKETCASIRRKGSTNKSKKRKGSPGSTAAVEPLRKKSKVPSKPRVKGPVNLDVNCGVINDKGLPCSRSLTCKSHSMGAKRSLPGRSRPYDELLLDWQRVHNPNFVEPVKRPSKAEKQAQRAREKEEKKRAAQLAAQLEPTASPGKKTAAAVQKKSSVPSKKAKKGAAAAAAAQQVGEGVLHDEDSIDGLDSEAELDALAAAVRLVPGGPLAHHHSASSLSDALLSDTPAVLTYTPTAIPLSQPADASTWFVHRRERARCSRDFLRNALATPAVAPPNGNNTTNASVPTGIMAQRNSLNPINSASRRAT